MQLSTLPPWSLLLVLDHRTPAVVFELHFNEYVDKKTLVQFESHFSKPFLHRQNVFLDMIQTGFLQV